MATETMAGLPILAFRSAADWEGWLADQPRSSKGVWLKHLPEESGAASVSHREAIDGALCHGWIDGQVQKYDECYWLIRFTPRLTRSKWSRLNRTRAEELIGDGRLAAAGLEEVNRARLDGRWDAAYPPQSDAAVPADLQLALDGNPEAQLRFSELDRLNRYAILHRVQSRCQEG